MNNLLGKVGVFAKRNSATILTCMGAAGVVATSVMAVKATPKALTLLEQAKEKKGEKLTKLETVQVAGPAYIPSVVMGAITIACIFGSNTLNKRQQAALISAYAMLDNSYKEYKNKVDELYGKEAGEKVREEIAKDKYEETDIIVSDGKRLFYDFYSGRYFESTMEAVQWAEYEVNRAMNVDGGVCLNVFYDFLGLEELPEYEELGWSEAQMHEMYWHAWIEFEHETTEVDEGLECTIINMPLPPFVNYLEY